MYQNLFNFLGIPILFLPRYDDCWMLIVPTWEGACFWSNVWFLIVTIDSLRKDSDVKCTYASDRKTIYKKYQTVYDKKNSYELNKPSDEKISSKKLWYIIF